MALFRKFFYRKPPDGLLEIAERVYVFDCCFTTNVLEDDEYKVYIGGIANQVRGHLPDASFMVFNFREGEKQSLISKILSEYDMTVMDYPRHYEGCSLLTMEMIHHFLRSSESWLSLGQQNVLLMHCERGGWPVLAFMLAALLIYRKQYVGEQKTLDVIYKQTPQELLLLMSPLNPVPSQLRYLQYISRRNVSSEWPPLDRALTLDCIIIRFIPNMDGEGGCRPVFRIYGQDPFMAADRTPKVLFSTPKRSKFVRYHKQEDCELVKIDIHCHIQGDVVLECISLDKDLEHEEIMFRVMFNTAFIRSNILMFSRDDIDILWNAKDRFPKDFRAEVLFSEMDAETSLISVDLPNTEEKEGLPIEAFNKVQEIFSNMNWMDPKTQQVSSPRTPEEKMVEETGNFAGPEELKAEPKSVEDDLRVFSLADQKDQSIPCSKPSSPADSAGMTIQRSSKSKIISLSAPVSHSNSLQGSPAPVSRYQSAPSAIGITALLHDHATSESCQVISPEELMPSSSSISSLADVVKPLEPIIVCIPPSPLLPPPHKPLQPKPSDETQPSDRLAPMPSPLPPPPLPGSFSPSPVKQASLLLPPPPPPPSPPLSSDIITLPPPAFSTVFSSRLSNSLSTPPPFPPPPPPSASSGSFYVSSSMPNTSNSLATLPPSSVPSESFSLSSTMPRVSNSLATPPPPAPPPPPPHSVTSGPFSLPSRMPNISNSLAPPPPPPSVPSGPFSLSSSMPRVSNSLATPRRPPPPSLSVPSGPFFVSSRMPSESNSLATPPPPPPLSVSPGPFCVSPRMPSVSNSLSTPPPPPLPPSSVPSGAFSVSSRMPVKNLADKSVPLSPPPPPPPPNINSKESASNNHAPISPIPPPPAPLPNGLTKTGDASSNSRTTNSKIPAIPGPPSSFSFNSKGRAPPRTGAKTLAQGKKSNLKPYHWLKLTRAVQGSLWAEAQKADDVSKAPEFDMSELESLFAATAPNSDNGKIGDKSKGRSSANKADKVQLIELRRANNCEIMLTKVKIPLPDLMSSVLALDEAALDADQIENLIKFCPTKEEMELLKGYGGDKENLGKCEQFFLELMKIPRVEPKLRVFSFKIQFRSQVSELRTNLNIVNSASDEIKSSVKLKKIMQTILSLGNALNHGTARGSAVGFRLDSLLKLTDTRARNNRMTLMHYLCKVLAEKLPELLDFPKDLKNLEASTKIQLKYLAEEMQAISKGIEKVVQELSFSDNDGPVSEKFSKTVKGFLNEAEAEVRSLTLLYSNVGRNADALAFYFGEDPARCPFEQVVSTLLNFVKMFSRAHEENCKQIENEKKKAQKEAENEKVKIGSPRKAGSDHSLYSPTKNRGIT